MELTLIDKLVWAGSAFLNFTLLLVLLFRRRARSVPWFTALIALGSLRTLTLFTTYRLFGRHHAYFLVYWWAAGIDLMLQIAVVSEIARTVFSRSNGWVPGARLRFLAFCSFAPVLALVLAITMKPAAKTALDAWDARANLFMTVLICVMCRAVMAVSKQLGVGWKARVTWMTWGLVVWSVAAFITDTLHSYWRTVDDFGRLESVLAVVYQLVTVYWIVIFWLPEPQTILVPERVIKDIGTISARLQ